MFRENTITFGAVAIHLLHYENFALANYMDCLTRDEQMQMTAFKSENRQREFLATRKLKSALFGHDKVIVYNEIGAPFLNDAPYISISHANSLVGIASCESFALGFDLEPIDAKVLRVKHKFLHEKEPTFFNVDSVTEMTRVWSAKEALYKLAQTKGLHFGKDLWLEPTSENETYLGHVRINSSWKSVVLKSIIYEETIVCATVNEFMR